MTKEKLNKDEEKEVPISPKSVNQESLFYIHELRENSRELFNVKPEVLDGVFFNAKKLRWSKAEVKKKIDAFLKKPVNKKEAKQ